VTLTGGGRTNLRHSLKEGGDRGGTCEQFRVAINSAIAVLKGESSRKYLCIITEFHD